MAEPLVYTDPLVLTEPCNPDEPLFDALLDLSWLVSEEMILKQGEIMYGGANQFKKVLNSSEREHKRFKINIKTVDLIAKDAHVNNFVEANEACVQFIK